MTVERLRPWALLLLALAGPLGAAPEKALKIPVGQADKLLPQAAFVAALLKKGGKTYFRLPAGTAPRRDAQGQWLSGALQAALRSQGPLALSGDTDGAGAGLKLDLEAVNGAEGRWLSATGLPAVTLVENSSTVSPLSKGLDAWKWPYKAVSFADVEADPRGVLDAAHSDLVVFSSPGWWDDFANPPGGPSRLPKKVAEALRGFVRQGGSAIFVDIAQWDLEKAWPKTLSLNPLGPYKVSKLKLEGGENGGVSLAPVGVATDRLRAKGAFGLLGSDGFAFPDGGTRQLYAAYAMPDPSGGQGWIAGLALHVFEQDDTLAARIRRLFLNLLLLSGQRRLFVPGEEAVPTLPPTLPTLAPSPTLVSTPIASPVPTVGAPVTQLPVPFVTAQTLPTPFPTQVVKALSLPSPGPLPTAGLPTPRPSPTTAPGVLATLFVPPTPLPTRIPTVAPTPLPTHPPTPPPTQAVPTAIPSSRPAPSTPPPSPPATPFQGREVKTDPLHPNILGCLASAPEPFAEGGVYLQYCLGRSAKVQVSVFDAQGRSLWRSPAAILGAGEHKAFFDGNINGRALVAGRYLWEVRATDLNGVVEARQGSLTRQRDKRRP